MRRGTHLAWEDTPPPEKHSQLSTIGTSRRATEASVEKTLARFRPQIVPTAAKSALRQAQ